MKRLLPLLMLLLVITPALGALLTDKENYRLGEDVTIKLPDAKTRLIVDAPEARYRLLGGSSGTFTPKTPGTYLLTLLDTDGATIAQSSFNVSAPEELAHTITVGEPYVNRNVSISITPPPTGDVEVTIIAPGGKFRYVGPWRDSPFVPRAEGEHQIIIAQGDAVIARKIFTVLPEAQAPVLASLPPSEVTPQEEPNTTLPEAIDIAPGEAPLVTFSIQDSSGVEKNARLKFNKKRGSTERYDVEVEPQQRAARRIVIRNLAVQPNLEIGVEDVAAGKIPQRRLHARGPVLKAYAIDLSNLNFTDATVTVVAEGTQLHKCPLWNFTTQTCGGAWEKVMNIVPGVAYNITVFPGDPGYAETGVATVNSVKPIYTPGETATLLMVVLDTSGFLVTAANVTLSITDPANATILLSTAANNIVEVERGVYRAEYGLTTQEGNYSLLVSATAPGVNVSMISSFTVLANYPFDILRNAPVTTDPFQGPFNTSLNVTPRIAVSTYNVTEVLPVEFDLVSAPGAIITSDSVSTYLTWPNLNGNAIVNYSAQPPKVAPNLFALGQALVTYVQGSITFVFQEVRAWFLAIDPQVTRDQGLVIYGDRANDGVVKQRNWTGTLLQGEENSIVDFGNRLSWFKERCLDNRAQCLIMVSDTGNDMNFAVFNTDNWSWSNITELDSNIGVDDEMGHDVECEDLTGDCVLVWEDDTGAADADFLYRIWNGSQLNAANTTVTVTGAGTDGFRWIKLYPQKGTDRIGIALQNDAGGTGGTPDIYAGMWNGSTFVNFTTLTTAGSSAGSERTNFRHFDCGWEGSTNRFMCVYGNNTVNGLLAKRWSNGSWSDLGNIYTGMGSEGWEFSVCGQEPWSSFNNSYIGIMMCDDANDLDGGYWNGTDFSKTTSTGNPAQNLNAECGTNKATTEWGQNFMCTWEDSGDQILYVWVNNGDNFLTSATYTYSTNTFSTSNWSLGTQIVATGAGDLRTTLLVPNQDSDKVFMTYTDASRDGGCSLWDGTSWDGSGCNGAATFEVNGPTAARQWLVFDWFRTPPPQPEIEILSPSDTVHAHNYTGVLAPSTSSIAWNGTNVNLPPNAAASPASGTEFSTSAYVNISDSDNTRASSVNAVNNAQHAYQSFNFTINDSVLSMSSIVLTHEGYATGAVAQTPDQFYIYIYNWTSDNYVLYKTVLPSAVDVISTTTITTDFSDLVNNRQMLVLVEGDFVTGAGANARAEVLTDYIGLVVSSIPTLRGNVTVNATAVDDDGIGVCKWAFFYTNNTRASSFINMGSQSGAYLNISTSTSVADGQYNITVVCNDTLGNAQNATKIVRVDNTPPSIQLYTPTNRTNLTVNSAIFSWNTTDILYENMICNVTINTTVFAESIVSAHNANVTRNITSLTDGYHNWSVACEDDAGNRNTSIVSYFDVDTTAPTVTAVSPLSNGFATSSTVNFTYTVSDVHSIVNCTLRLDTVQNTSTASVTNGATNNFTVAGLREGNHTWNVTCRDSFGFNGTFASVNFTVDYTAPAVYLNISNGTTFNNVPVVLNYTAIDTVDSILTCNITINGTITDSNIASANNTLISRTQAVVDGHKLWNVTCRDDAGNVNVSVSRVFIVIGGPVITLNSPANNTVGNGSYVRFNYSAQDGDGLANCSLIIDNVVNQTNLTPTNNAYNYFNVTSIAEGIHPWYVNCTDSTGTVGTSTPRNIISDRSKPIVTLNGPSAGQVLNVTPTNFNFTVTDSFSSNFTCNITVDNTVNAANLNFIVQNNTLTARTQTVINGVHFWNVTCYDLGGNFNVSLTRNFTINVTFPLNVTVTSDKTLYQGETAFINITVRNESNQMVSSNITLDYIYTNNTFTDLAWWNTSWSYRKPIYINETDGVARSNKVIPLNLTGLFGKITSCTNDIRVIGDDDLLPRNVDIVSGDDVTYCYLQFNGSASASTNNQQDYHVYYGNPTATNPGYVDPTVPITIFFDDFADAGTTGWTTDSGWDRDTGNPLPGGHAHVDGVVVNVNMSPSSSFNLAQYDQVNISFDWEITTAWDAGEFITLDYTNNSGTTWSQGISSLDGNVNEGSVFTFSQTLNNTFKVNGFNAHFRATTDNANEDGGFDNFNITGYFFRQNVTTGTGEEQEWIARNTTTTNTTGNVTLSFSTLGRTVGNYSSVARATTTNANNREGTGYDVFRIIADQVGPNTTLVSPTNYSTYRSGNVTFIYLADDAGTTIANCSLYVNGVRNQTNVSAVNESTQNNFTFTNAAESRYNWFVSCFDSSGNNANSSTYTLFLDDTPPRVTLFVPNGSTYSTSTVQFSFNASDNFDTLIQCNISLNVTNYSILINATNGTNTSVNITNINEGNYTWNATCQDNANNTNSTTSLSFKVDANPVVRLDSPADGYGVNSTNVTLFFNVTEGNLANCSLYINNTLNQTKSAAQIPFVTNNGKNNFTLTNLTYGLYNWTVVCVDLNGFNGTDTRRQFQIDNALPNITLGTPINNDTLFSSTVTFNFSVTDVDPILACNVTVNGARNASVNATAGAVTLVNGTGFTVGNYTWNVTCIDNTGFTQISETRNFSIVARVDITLVSPANNSFDGDGVVTFSYIPQSIAGFTFGFCDLYIDNIVNDTHASVTNAATDSFTVSTLSQGNHSWKINCTDSSARTGVSENRTFIVDSADPNVRAITPNATTLNSSVTFVWNSSDNIDTVLLCNVTVNNTVQTPASVSSPNNTLTNATYSSFTDGLFLWNVTCVDDALRTNTSNTLNFTVAEPPRIILSAPANNNRTRAQNITFFYTPSDNSGALANCTLVLNNISNMTNTSPLTSGSQANLTLNNTAEGSYVWTFNCTDPSRNVGTNSTPFRFTIDLTPPSMNLTTPANNSAINGNNVTFNWTASDTSASTLSCNITVTNGTGQLYGATLTQANGSVFSTTINLLGDGPHNWSVTCRDDVGNLNTSANYSFVINQPDLSINNSQLTFNNTNPAIGENITIRANVSNYGGITASNAIVQFWDGLPNVGVFIGNSTQTVAVNASVIFSVSWNVTAGYHTIWAIVDPDNAVAELNETNNNASATISPIFVNITLPANNTITNDNTPQISFNATDFTAGTMGYRIFVDGVATAVNGSFTAGSNMSVNVSTLSDGIRRIVVQANDSLGRARNSTALTTTIDTQAPQGVFVTRNGTFYGNATPIVEIRINDSLDAVIDYTILVNGTANASGTVANATNTNVTLSTFSNGIYNLTIQSFDDAGNYANSSSILIYVDTLAPTITLNSPLNNTNFTVRTATLNYTPTDNLDPLLGCFLTLDGTTSQYANVSSGASQTYTTPSLGEGAHFWNATCWDGDNNVNQINNNATSSLFRFNIYIAPNITLITPANNTISNNATQVFVFNVSDETGLANCSIYINGIINTTNTSALTLNGTNNLTVTGLNNTNNWSVVCVDSSVGFVVAYSENRTIIIDSVAPRPNITTTNASWFSNSSPTINFTITDNYDTTLNWSLFVDGVFNVNGTVANGTASATSLSGLTNGAHTIILQGADDAGNYGNSSSIVIYVDTVVPTVTLVTPVNDSNISDTQTTLNFTAYDNLASALACNLTLDGSVVQQYNLTNNTYASYQATGLTSGYHTWNATCIDNATNRGSSSTFRFFIQVPDFVITAGNITFSNSTPIENQTVAVNATIFNIGFLNATNITAQFWFGDPNAGGVQLGSNYTISSLNISQNVTINISVQAVIGLNQIYVVVDPPTATNGTYVESNESNNKANRNFNVGLFEVFAGGSLNTLRIADTSIIAAFTWNQTETNGSNVFVADTESAVSFTSLQAIGRNATNGTSVGTDDFTEIDTKLNTSTLNDSVNLTFTSSGQPLGLVNMSAFKRQILNVPVINSTNTTSFRTGILWDMADGGSFYNGSQDIAFVTMMNQSQLGQYGTYDYEIKIPARLREYIAGGGTVTFYTELR